MIQHITDCLIVYHCVGLNMAMSSQSQSSQSGELTSDDLPRVFESVYSITPNYVNFGMKLNVPLHTIRIIEMQYANPCDRLLQILDCRLKQLPRLTWHDIVRALQSPLLDQHDLARTIESRYITASQSPASVSQQASAESSHAAIHTSGALPSTHAPPQPPLHTVAAAGQRPSTSNDLPHLLNVLNPVASKCYYIGLQLGVKNTQIANIRFNYTKCEDQLREILVERLKQEPPLTWQDIVTALRADSVREYDLANEVESTHILALHPPAAVTPQISIDSSMSPSTQCVSSHASLQPLLPASVSQQASAESSHAAIHTSGAQPSTHAPPQPPLHTGVAASVALTHAPIALPQPPIYNTGQPLQLIRPLFSVPLTPLVQHIKTQDSQSFQDMCTLYPPQFIAYIRDVYRRSIVGDCKDTKWPPRAFKVFIQLAIINRKTVSFREADEYTKAMVIDGNVDAILHEKRAIELSEIAKDVPQNRIIIVEGAPGVGKSTFAWEFCRRWERGEIAQQYQLVLLLRLRDERMSTAKSLKDLIYHPDKVLCQSMKKELKANHGSNVLFILEGFDELPDTCRAKSSIFMKLINGDILYKSTVLVTSRPWAMDTIHRVNASRIFQHIEILGFTEPQIKEYVTSALSNPDNDLDENAKDDFDDIVKYIDTYPQIKACMYIPLNTAIVVGVYEESKVGRCSLPKTLTQLYQALTQTILVRYLRGHREYSQQSCNVRDLKKDLPQEVYDNLLKICLLAYKGIFDREDNIKLVFSDLPPNFETLDLMQSVPQMYITRGEVMSHNFLHLTVQEYFCAQHISFMSAEKQLEHFQKHKDGRFRVVLRFLAGLTKLTVLTHDQFKGLLREIPDQQGDEQQRDCCKRMIPDISVSVHHINWLFEAQNTNLLHNHTVRFKFTGTMQPLEYYSLGYCIVHSNCKW